MHTFWHLVIYINIEYTSMVGYTRAVSSVSPFTHVAAIVCPFYICSYCLPFYAGSVDCLPCYTGFVDCLPSHACFIDRLPLSLADQDTCFRKYHCRCIIVCVFVWDGRGGRFKEEGSERASVCVCVCACASAWSVCDGTVCIRACVCVYWCVLRWGGGGGGVRGGDNTCR